MSTRIAIINCYDPNSPPKFSFENEKVNETELLERRITNFRKVETNKFNIIFDEFPKKIEEFDAYIISGSNFNPDRASIIKYEWMRELLSFVRKVHESNTAVLGICFGHQIISIAFGGKVFKLPEIEIGFRKINLNENGKKDKLFAGVPQSFFGAFVHDWAVYKSSLPFGSELLAESPKIPNQATAFRIGKNSYAVQFHPERVSKDVKTIYELKKNLVGKKVRFNHSESSDANTLVLKNFINKISKK